MAVLVTGAIAFASVALSAFFRASSLPAFRRTLWFGAAISLAFIFSATLFPAPPTESSRVLLDPTEGLDDLQALGNVVLFLPLGACLALFGSSLRTALIAGAGLSALIELSQFSLVTGRYTSTGDVILNMVGGVLGHLAATAVLAHRGRRKSSPRS
ncbi:MAG: VanZ family protein [Actinobacteria bacterium]|nr:VanZ family protein [Actinomycetota bacterium]